MILDHLNNAARYRNVHPGFPAALDWLDRSDLGELAEGRHEIDGERLFAIVALDPGKGRDAARLEVHRKYIDIQAVVAGADVMGWKPLGQCTRGDGEFDAAKDAGFFADAPDAWVAVSPGAFAIFFPEDAHAPLAGDGPLRKVIVKIAVAWP